MSNLKIQLDPREDRDNNIFYIGRLSFPGVIYFDSGVTFLVFLSESGEEEVQITKNNKENSTYSKFSRRDDRLKIELDTRKDQYGKTFYIAKLKFNGSIDCSSNDIVFIVFNSKEGEEELQVVGSIEYDDVIPKESSSYKGLIKDKDTQIFYKKSDLK
jgi:hypothetical protein